METPILVARIVAVVYISIGLGFLLNGKYYEKVMHNMLDDASFLMFGGMMSTVIGGLILANYNVWASDWTVLVTIIGWLALAKGVFLLAAPRSFKMFKPLLKSKNLRKFLVPFTLLLGIVFAYFGFLDGLVSSEILLNLKVS